VSAPTAIAGPSRRDLISAWMRALDAAWRATHAALEDGDLTGQEVQRLEQRLRAERDWTRREFGTISGFPYPKWAHGPMRSDTAKATLATATKEECHDCHAHHGPRSGPATRGERREVRRSMRRRAMSSSPAHLLIWAG
jgi:hypothetical protein